MSDTRYARISDFCQTGSGTTPSRQKSERYYGGDIPWVKSGELREGLITKAEETVTDAALKETSLRLVPAGALLVAMYGATVGRVGRLGIQATTNQAVCHIVPDPSVADERYMFHALCAKASELISKGVGGAQPNISQGTIKETQIYLPHLDEQKRIAAILDQADELRRLRQKSLDRLNTLSQSIFHEMFGELLRDEDARTPLGEVCDVRDGTHDSPKYVDDGFPLLTSKNFSAGHIDYNGASLISEKDFELINKRSKVDKGDIVMPMIGTIGSPVIIDIEPDFAIKNVALVKFRNNGMDAEFVRQILDSSLFKSHVSNKGRGGTQKFVSLGDIRAFKVPLPSPDQQKSFANKITLLRIQQIKFSGAIAQTNMLFSSLQHRAFRGEL